MLLVYDLSVGLWLILILGAFLIGVAKTALPGLATVSVAMFAAVIPARESTAMLLILLLVGDLFAVWIYRREADWSALKKLVPAVFAGLVVGAVVLGTVDDRVMKKLIGAILLTLTAVTLGLMAIAKRAGDAPKTSFGSSVAARWTYGSLGGFTTMVANSGGPPMTLYFIASGFDMVRFLGTQAWFFFLVNLAKVPFQAGLGLHSARSLGTDLLLVGVVILGAGCGRLLIKHLNPALFNPIVIGLTVLSSLYLLV